MQSFIKIWFFSKTVVSNLEMQALLQGLSSILQEVIHFEPVNWVISILLFPFVIFYCICVSVKISICCWIFPPFYRRQSISSWLIGLSPQHLLCFPTTSDFYSTEKLGLISCNAAVAFKDSVVFKEWNLFGKFIWKKATAVLYFRWEALFLDSSKKSPTPQL